MRWWIGHFIVTLTFNDLLLRLGMLYCGVIIYSCRYSLRQDKLRAPEHACIIERPLKGQNLFMKRLLVCLCCAALLGSAYVLPGVAEGETEPSNEPTASSSATTATTSTEPEPTPTMSPTPTFQFAEYSRTYDETTGVLTVTWNYAAGGGAEATAVIVDGVQHSASGSGTQFSARVGSLGGGSHALQYVFRLSDGTTQTVTAEELHVTIKRSLRLSLTAQGSRTVATLTDDTGAAVADYPLQFTLNRATTVNRSTNQNGQVDMTVTGTLTTVTCVAPGRTVGGIQYTGVSEIWQADASSDSSVTQATDDEAESTTSRTRWSATQKSVTTGANKTYATIQGAGTTSVEGQNVVVNATFDEGVVDAFGLENDDFNKRARMLMSADLYSSLVGDSKAAVMMTLGYNGTEITDQQISKLVSGKSKYSRYSDIKRVALTMGLQFVDESKKTVAIQVAPAGSYTVRLPVPDAMLDCPVLAVAMIEKDGLSHIVDVQVKNGYLEFVTNGFTSIAVLGFGDHAVRTGGGVAWQLIVLLAAGVLMLAGAALLTFLFVLRKPKKLAADSVEEADGTTSDAEQADEPDLHTEVASEFMIDQILNEHATNPQDMPQRHELEEDSYDLYSSDSRRPHQS